MINPYFKECFFYSNIINKDIITLDSDETHHLYHVLNLKTGTVIHVCDGQGRIYRAGITEIQKTLSACRIIDYITYPAPEPEIIMGAGILKARGFEKLLEETLPFCLKKIIPLKTAYTFKPSRIDNKAVQRWNDKARTILKQTKTPFLTTVEQPVNLSDFWKCMYKNGKVLLMNNLTEEAEHISDIGLKQIQRITLLVGPEGGFSNEEIQLSLDNGAAVTTLGKSRLRSETAAMAAACAIRLFTKSL
ncbi:MAG: RsmE family RNA methyltransferase [bacterium]